MTLPITNELWLAPGVGIIKRRESGGLLNLTAAYGLSASTSFSVVEGAPELPAVQSLKRDITPLKASEYSAKVTYANAQNGWLNLSVDSSGVYAVRPNTSALSAGEYAATITFESANHWPYVLSVHYFVEEPRLTGPESLQFDLSAAFDSADLKQTLTLANTGLPVSLSIAADANWIKLVDKTVDPAVPVYEISINPNAFFTTPTLATATVVVTYDNGYRDNNELYVPVIVHLPAQGMGAAAIDFTNISGNAQAPVAVALNWLNQSALATNFTPTISCAGGAGSWLSVTAAGGSGALQAQIQHSNLTPGVHSATITLTDADGFAVDYDVTFTIGPPYMTAPASRDYDIDENTQETELTQTFALQRVGGPLQWSVSSSAAWLVATKKNSDPVNGDMVQIAVANIKTLADSHYDATVTVVYDNDFIDPVTVKVPVSVDVAFPKVMYPLPYVVYKNKAATIAVNGSRFSALSTRRLMLDATPITPTRIVDDRELQLALPNLSAGEHVLYVDNVLGIRRASGRLLVKAEPVYADAEIDVPGRVESIAYDEEREAFFAVLCSQESGVENTLARIQYQTDRWKVDPILIGNAVGIALTSHGKTLLVTDRNCNVKAVNPNTLKVVKSTRITGCSTYDQLGLITQLYTGEILVGATTGGPVWRYPSQEMTSIPILYDSDVIRFSGGRKSAAQQIGGGANANHYWTAAPLHGGHQSRNLHQC